MPISFEIVPSIQLVVNQASGVVTDDELIAVVVEIGKHPQFEPHFKQFYDLRGVTDFQVSSPGVRRLAAANPFRKGSRRALLCAADVVYGMARMYEVFSDDRADELYVFKDLEDALDWLQISEEQAERVRQLIGDR